MKANKLFLKLKKGLTNPDKFGIEISNVVELSDKKVFTFKHTDKKSLKFLKDHLSGIISRQIDLIPCYQGFVKVTCGASHIIIDTYWNESHHVGSQVITPDKIVDRDMDSVQSESYTAA